MASLIASKTEILKESRKIKTSPRSHQIKLLTFKKKIHYTKFVDWVDSSDDAIKKVKLPKRRELLNLGGSSNLGMILALGIANFWKEIKALLEKFGFGNWKVGLGLLGLGALGLGALVSKIASRLNPFRSLKGVRRGPINTLKRLKKRWFSPFDKNRKLKIERLRRLREFQRNKWFQEKKRWIQENKRRISKVVEPAVKRLKGINPFRPKSPANNIVPFTRDPTKVTPKKNWFSGITERFKQVRTKVKPPNLSGVRNATRGISSLPWLSGIFAGVTLHDRKVNQKQSNTKAITGTIAETACAAALGAKGAAWGTGIGGTLGAAAGGIGAVPGAFFGGLIGGAIMGTVGSWVCGSASDAIVDKIEEGSSQCTDCGDQSSTKVIEPNEKTVVVSQKAQSNDGDTTIVMAPKEQQVLPSQPAQQGGVIPFPVGGGNNSAMIASSVPESETLNNMWTNILLTKLSTS